MQGIPVFEPCFSVNTEAAARSDFSHHSSPCKTLDIKDFQNLGSHIGTAGHPQAARSLRVAGEFWGNEQVAGIFEDFTEYARHHFAAAATPCERLVRHGTGAGFKGSGAFMAGLSISRGGCHQTYDKALFPMRAEQGGALRALAVKQV